MYKKTNLLEELKELIHLKRSIKYYSERLNITEIEVIELKRELKKNIERTLPELNLASSKVDNIKGTLETTLITDFEPKNDIELARLHKINLDKYIITNYWSKLLPNGNYTSSVFSKLKKSKDYTPEDFSNFLANYKAANINVEKPFEDFSKENLNFELSISDYHLAKKYRKGNNSVLDRANAFFKIAQDLIHKARSVYNIDDLIFPISNDFFHTDNYQNQTTAGTPQDVILEYDQEYELGFSILVDTINMLKANAMNIKVVLVQGNHDRTKSFYLAHALEVFFKNEKDVSFIRHHDVVKAVVIGNTFIGYHHGNCKIEDLPLLFATHPEYSKMFGESKYREVHTGDKHHYMAKEIKGVRIQQMPSLSDSDRWHIDGNYVNSIRAALLLGYDLERGKCCEFEKRI